MLQCTIRKFLVVPSPFTLLKIYTQKGKYLWKIPFEPHCSLLPSHESLAFLQHGTRTLVVRAAEMVITKGASFARPVAAIDD
jgi:hypothetical protein